MQVKYFILFVFYWMISFSLLAQSNCPKYTSAIQQGKAFLNKKTPDFDKALNAFQAAQLAARECGLEEAAGKVAAREIKKVFDGLRRQRNDAIKDRKVAQQALAQVEEEQEKTAVALATADSLNAKNEKLIDAFYFYDGKLALAYKNGKYGFINKNGDAVINYQYKKAEQFDDTGFAKVKKEEKNTIVNYLIDTTGQEYKVAYSFKNLTKEIKALDLRGSALDSFPIAISALRQLKIVILNETHSNKDTIHSLLNNIKGFKQLTYLSLRNCKIKQLPKEFGQLKNLQYLDLRNNELNTLPKSFGQLKNLKYLNLNGNQLKILPQNFGKLSSLKRLELTSNQLENLPNSFGQLSNLKQLNLNGNQLKDLPQNFGQLSNLIKLDLIMNQLQCLPESFGKLNKLQTIHLYGSQLISLPENFGQLNSLKKIDFSSNQLQSLPESFGQLHNLESLSLFDNRLNTLPESFGQLINLQSLSLYDNRLKHLPQNFGQLVNLQYLDLTYSQLSTLPENFGHLSKLQKLELKGNKLNSLPETFGQLRKLQDLDLSRNKLISLPESIGQLDELKSLDLIKNPLKSIPQNIFNLNLNSVSWYIVSIVLIKNRNYPQAITAAQKSLELKPGIIIIHSKLAVAYLLNNQYTEAGKIYLKWKGKSFIDNQNKRRFSTKIFLQDITDQETNNIHHPDFQKAKQLLNQ